MASSGILSGTQSSRPNSLKRNELTLEGISSLNSYRPISSSHRGQVNDALRNKLQYSSLNIPSDIQQQMNHELSKSTSNLKPRASSLHSQLQQQKGYFPTQSSSRVFLKKQHQIQDDVNTVLKMSAIHDTYYHNPNKDKLPEKIQLSESKSRMSLIAKLIADKNGESISKPSLQQSQKVIDSHNLNSPNTIFKYNGQSQQKFQRNSQNRVITPRNLSKDEGIHVNFLLDKYKQFIEKSKFISTNIERRSTSTSARNHPLQQSIRQTFLNEHKGQTQFNKKTERCTSPELISKPSPSLSHNQVKPFNLNCKLENKTPNIELKDQEHTKMKPNFYFENAIKEIGATSARLDAATQIHSFRIPSNLKVNLKVPQNSFKSNIQSEAENSPQLGVSRASTYFDSISLKPRVSTNYTNMVLPGGSLVESAITERTLNEDEIKFLNDVNSQNSQPSIDDFSCLQVLGHGSYAIVRSAIHKNTQFIVAIKSYDKSKLSDPQKKQNVEREVKILMNLNHKNIIKLYKVIESLDHVNLIMEYSPCQSLSNYLKLKEKRKLQEKESKLIFKQLVEAVDYLHRKKVIHRDIKLENILIDANRHIKLIDFGFSIVTSNSNQLFMFCGTPSYMAPEIINKTGYSFAVDYWALGVLLTKILSGIFPIQGSCDKSLYRKIVKCEVEIPGGISVSARKLISAILQEQPENRLPLEKILKHEWVESK